MATFHFLNVRTGDCSIIEHNTGRVSVIDVCNAEAESQTNKLLESINEKLARLEKGVLGNFNQAKYPVNPISYMNKHGILGVHRFILTHPDMDHMDGIKALFDEFPVLNFWDTDNQETKEFGDESPYDEEDWKFYLSLRDGKPQEGPKRLALYAGQIGKLWNQEDGGTGDGLQILAPTEDLCQAANECGDYNDCSYVLLYRVKGYRILISGDSHDGTWDHILEKYETDVKDVDLLIAPHHGRDSDRSYDFLDVVNPALTLFGYAKSEFMAYAAWSARGLKKITNNQAGCIVVDTNTNPAMSVYVTCEAFAKASNPHSFASSSWPGYFYYGNTAR